MLTVCAEISVNHGVTLHLFGEEGAQWKDEDVKRDAKSMESDGTRTMKI